MFSVALLALSALCALSEPPERESADNAESAEGLYLMFAVKSVALPAEQSPNTATEKILERTLLDT